MKLQALIQELQELNLDPDTDVWLAQDPEGNGYRQITEVERSWFVSDPAEPFAVHVEDEAEYRDDPYFEVAVVLWP